MDKLQELIPKYTIGDPMLNSTWIGPSTLPETPLEIQELIEDAVQSSANLIYGGRPVKHEGANGLFFEPTLLADVEDHMRISNEECYGPVLTLDDVENVDEVL